MFEYAGILYWPLEQALHTDINYLLVSYTAHIHHLSTLFGGSDTTTQPEEKSTKSTVPLGGDGKPIQLTPAVFDSLFPEQSPPLRAKVQ